MLIDDYLHKDPKKFFSPLFEYALSEFLENTEKPLADLGYKYYFLPELKLETPKDKDTRDIVEKLGLDGFPVEAYKLMKGNNVVIVGYGLGLLHAISRYVHANSTYVNFHHIVSKVDAGSVPVVHSHLLFKGSPHPLTDDIAFNKIETLGGFKPTIDNVERSLYDYEIKFKHIFSDWSVLVHDLKKAADLVESKLDSERGAREFYALSVLMDGKLDLATLWDRVGRVMELPGAPNLDVLILR